jgi:uncharacterized membrane protein
MTTREFVRQELPVLVLLAIPFVAIPFFWEALPERVPMQWNLRGDVNWYAGRALAATLLPALNVFLYLFYTFFPVVDPKRQTRVRQKPLPALRFYTILLLTGIYFLHMAEASGLNPFSMVASALLVVTLVILVTGNYLSALKPNYFVGIRTPWTLEDAEIWSRVHRSAARLWVTAASCLLIAWLLMPPDRYAIAFTATMVLIVAVPVLQSYLLYRTRRGDRGAEVG